MTWISGWLKELIVIVLIAGFIDLLLPAPSMQRYVKTVIGLFLLLVMLAPIFRLFESKWTPEQLIAAAEAKQEAAATGTIPSLGDIMRNAGRLRQDNEQQAEQLLDHQLAASIQSGIETQLQQPVERVDVKTRLTKDGQPAVESIAVVLAAPGPKQAATDDPPNQLVVKPMKPIVVNIAPIGSDPPAVPAVSQDSSAKVSKAASEQVKQYVSKEWQVKPDIVEVRAASG